MMSIALQGASLTPREGAEPIAGEQLKEMADQHTIAYNIIQRISRMIDMDVLSAIMNGAKLNLNSMEEAEQPPGRLRKSLTIQLLKSTSRIMKTVILLSPSSKLIMAMPTSPDSTRISYMAMITGLWKKRPQHF